MSKGNTMHRSPCVDWCSPALPRNRRTQHRIHCAKPLESRSIFSSDLLDLWQGLSHEITKYFQIFKINWAIKQLVPLDTMFLVLKWTSTLFCSFQVFCAYTKVDNRERAEGQPSTLNFGISTTQRAVLFFSALFRVWTNMVMPCGLKWLCHAWLPDTPAV